MRKGKDTLMNLVSTILGLLTPAIISRIASSLGLGQGLVTKAITAAVPAILAGLTGVAAKPGGAAQLSNVLAQQDPDRLGNLANLIGGGGQPSLIESGTSALTSLLGSSSTNSLLGALGKFAGIDSNQSASLLGLVAPVVLGKLAQMQRSSGLDANGLANLLNSQKSSIAAAMPAGFSDLLSGSGILDPLAGNLKSTASQTVPVRAASDDFGALIKKWLLPLALGLLGLYLLSSYGCDRAPEKTMAPAPVETAPPATSQPKAEVPTPAPAHADLVSVATKALDGLTTTLNGIKDESTATASIPALQEIAKQVDGLRTSADLLSGEAREPLATLLAGALPSILAAIEKAVGIPGVGAIINPILQPVIANLEALAKN
jgi:hypothetical protein